MASAQVISTSRHAPEFHYRGWTAYRVMDDETGERCTLLKIDRWTVAKTSGWLPDKTIRHLVDMHQSRLKYA